jgi:hypothetical protein
VKKLLQRERPKSFPNDIWFNAVLQLGTDTNRVLRIRGEHGAFNLVALARLHMHQELTAEDLEKAVKAIDKVKATDKVLP